MEVPHAAGILASTTESVKCLQNKEVVVEGALAGWAANPPVHEVEATAGTITSAFRHVSMMHGSDVGCYATDFVKPGGAAPQQCGFRLNRFEAQVRDELTKLLAHWITNREDVHSVVEALMRELLWWPKPPDEMQVDPESRVRCLHKWCWDEAPTILQRLVQARGGRAADSYTFKKYRRGSRERVRALVEAEYARNCGDIVAACKKLADKKSDPTLYPLKAETIRTYYRDESRRNRDSPQ